MRRDRRLLLEYELPDESVENAAFRTAAFEVADHAYGVGCLATQSPASRREQERVAAAAAGFAHYLRLRPHSLNVQVTRAHVQMRCHVSQRSDIVVEVSFSPDWEHEVRHALTRAGDVFFRDFPRFHPMLIPTWLDLLWQASVNGRLWRDGFRSGTTDEAGLAGRCADLLSEAGDLSKTVGIALVRRVWGHEIAWSSLLAVGKEAGLRDIAATDDLRAVDQERSPLLSENFLA